MVRTKRKSNKKKKIFKLLVTIIIFITILFTLITIFINYYIHEPGFWVDVTFKNESGSNIKITPIGIIEGKNEIGPLIKIKKSFNYQKNQNTRFNLNDNESIKITYDFDDQNLQFVIIEYPGDDIRILKIDADFWENKTYRSFCWAPQKEKYIIPSNFNLPLCPEILKPTIKGEYVKVNDELIDIFMNL